MKKFANNDDVDRVENTKREYRTGPEGIYFKDVFCFNEIHTEDVIVFACSWHYVLHFSDT